MIDQRLLGMAFSELVYHAFGFGSSRSICDPFAEQVIAEARAVGYDLVATPPQEVS